MPELTLLLDAAAAGNRNAAADLLPLVYDELRKLAAARMAAESPDQTLQPTALVHEAYCGSSNPPTLPIGRTAVTSSLPRPRPCGASWSIRPDGKRPPDTAAK
jgi:ECF sigma factor